MSTATLARPATRLISLPAGATWKEPQRPDHIRPCQTRPANWWDTGDRNNARAVALCGECPFLIACKPTTDEDVAGQIRAGVAYDDDSRPVDLRRLPHHHHDLIVKLRAEGKSYGAISKATGVSIRALSAYCRAQGIPTIDRRHAGSGIARHHDLIVQLRYEGLSWQEIADRIGRERDGVRTYWRRYQQRANAQRQAVAA